MKISTLNGNMNFASGSIGADTTRSQFLDSPLGQTVKAEIARGSRHQFDFDPEAEVSGTAFFEDERLKRVHLMMAMPSDVQSRLSAALELERKSKHDQWLAKNLGIAPYSYQWGSITSDFDPRGCSSEIIVAYDR